LKVAYIAGPYRAPTVRGIVENIQAAEAVALKYWRAGYAVICPHKNSSLFDGAAEDDVWIEGDKEILLRCDVLVAMRGWERSAGATEEVDEAERLGKEIIFDDGVP